MHCAVICSDFAATILPFSIVPQILSGSCSLKIWGTIDGAQIKPATAPTITAQCVRVPVSDGHLAAVFVAFDRKPSREQILSAWAEYTGRPQQLGLPSAPVPFLHYIDAPDRPQTRLDRDLGRGQAISLGRLRPDAVFDWRFIGLSHNTVRGAAGGSVLTAELLKADGYLTPR